ncbi:hypothetical protein [Capybara microvirus Cap3_SP_472]|nr:hypothetical protein [Capybara microvirus Cap3_SP_472]
MNKIEYRKEMKKIELLTTEIKIIKACLENIEEENKELIKIIEEIKNEEIKINDWEKNRIYTKIDNILCSCIQIRNCTGLSKMIEDEYYKRGFKEIEKS